MESVEFSSLKEQFINRVIITGVSSASVWISERRFRGIQSRLKSCFNSVKLRAFLTGCYTSLNTGTGWLSNRIEHEIETSI
jgi:hypothetical protein